MSMHQRFLQNITDNYENQASLHNNPKGEQEYSNYSKESLHHSSMKKQQSAHSRQRYSLTLQSKLDNLNLDLKYAGFKEISSFCFCESNNFDQICQLLNNILFENKKIVKKNKEHYEHIFKQNMYLKQLEALCDKLKQNEAKAIKDKENNTDYYLKINRENKQKIEKMLKEKDTFVRERKSWAQKQDVMKNYTRNIDERMRTLQERLKKIQKLDKFQYKNVFEVNMPLSKAQRSLVQKEYEQTVVQTIELHCKRLQEQNGYLKEHIRQFFGKIQKIVAKIGQGQYQHTLYKQEIVELPYNFNKQKGCPQIIKKILWIIEEKLNESKILPFKTVSNNNYSCDVVELTQSVNHLKGFYSVWQEINHKRNNIIPSIFRMFNEKQKISKLAQMMDYEQLQQADSQQIQEGNQIQRYISKKIEEYNKQLKRIGIQKNQIQNWHSQLS